MMERPDAWLLTDRLHAEQGKGDPFAAAVRATRMAMIVTDPRQDDNPIVFANDAFLRLTGYERDEVIDRNCRFLQGPETDYAAVAKVRAAIAAEVDINIDLLNYRKDQSTFWNALYISPVHNENGELLYFFASQLDVTDRQTALRDRENSNIELKKVIESRTTLLHELDHRVKNILQMITAMITLQSRNATHPESQALLGRLLDRVVALGAVHRRLYQSSDISRFELASFVGEIAPELIDASGRADIALKLEISPVVVSAEKASPIALIINELLINALKHAFFERGGTITIAIRMRDGQCEVVIEDDGPGVAEKAGPRQSSGRGLVERLARQLMTTAIYERVDPSGTRVRIEFSPA